MSRREQRLKGRRKDAVVFLDANISVGLALYLADLRRYAHWISFDSPPTVSNPRRISHPGYTKAERRRMRDFFDRVGDKNMFDPEGEPPNKLKDDKLLTYMVRLMEEIYPGRDLYLFYTHDKKFLIQDLLMGHPRLPVIKKEFLSEELLKKYPHLSVLTEKGKLSYIPLDTPGEKGKLKEVARTIHEDFLRRMDDLIA